MDTLSILLSIAVPWMIGAAILWSVRPARSDATAPGENAWTLGAGYALGAFILTAWMRLLSLAHVRFGALVVAVPLITAAGLISWIAWRRSGAMSFTALWTGYRPGVHAPETDRSMRLFSWLLIAWIAVRFILIGVEVGERPLYPWDAWIQWATKARVWYELGYLAPFGRAAAWLNANGTLYFDASPEYPPTMPLMQVWSCLVLGRWSDSLMNWPWWMLFGSLVLGVYGAMRSLGVGPMLSLVATTCTATLPLANVHVALAGYADLPMAVYYTLAVLAVSRWGRTRRAADAAIAVLLAIACSQIKNPGIVWALTLAPGVIVTLMPRIGVRVSAASIGVALLLLAVLAQTDPVIFNYRLHLDFNPSWQALGQTLLLLDNWHLLWWGVIVITIVAWRQLLVPPVLPLTFICAAALTFLLLVFAFTNARIWVSDQTTVNRAVLHFAPVALVFAVLAFDAFTRSWSKRFQAASAPVTEALPADPHPAA